MIYSMINRFLVYIKLGHIEVFRPYAPYCLVVCFFIDERAYLFYGAECELGVLPVAMRRSTS